MVTKVTNMIYNNYLGELFGSRLKIKVIRSLYRFKEKSFTLRELALLSGVTHPGLLKILKDLDGMGLVKLERISKSIIIKLNRSSFLLNILKVYDIEENTLNELIKKIKRYFVNKDFNSVAIFGSVSRREEKFNSDIDLLIITKNKKLAGISIEKCVPEIIQLFGNVIKPYILNKNEFNHSNIKKNVMENHILIKGKKLK